MRLTIFLILVVGVFSDVIPLLPNTTTTMPFYSLYNSECQNFMAYSEVGQKFTLYLFDQSQYDNYIDDNKFLDMLNDSCVNITSCHTFIRVYAKMNHKYYYVLENNVDKNNQVYMSKFQNCVDQDGNYGTLIILGSCILGVVVLVMLVVLSCVIFTTCEYGTKNIEL